MFVVNCEDKISPKNVRTKIYVYKRNIFIFKNTYTEKGVEREREVISHLHFYQV